MSLVEHKFQVVLHCSNAVAQVSDVSGRTCHTKPMRVPLVRRGSDRSFVGGTDCKVLRDGDFWWARRGGEPRRWESPTRLR